MSAHTARTNAAAPVLAPSYRAAPAGMRQHLETPRWRGPGQYWAVDVVPLFGEGGAVNGGMAFWRDITKRHRAEEAPRQHRHLRQQLRDEQAELRRTIATPRPLVLDQRGLAAAVDGPATATGARAGLDACEVTVDLDGPPLDPAHTQAVADSHGFGLTCMRERLQAIGGELVLRSAPGAGTSIQAQAAARTPS